MERKKTIRRFLPQLKDFKAFWKKHGPFKYALTSAEFPPILLEPEEWIFSDDIITLLKDLMQWDSRCMAVIEAPLKKSRDMLKPESLTAWKINNFPKEWEGTVCSTFTPLGYLTDSIIKITADDVNTDKSREAVIENSFFKSLASNIDKIGYVLLKPEPLLGISDAAYIDSYIKEWESDEYEDTF